jgi:hypothetical protein
MSKAIRANTVTIMRQLIATLTGINWPAFGPSRDGVVQAPLCGSRPASARSRGRRSRVRSRWNIGPRYAAQIVVQAAGDARPPTDTDACGHRQGDASATPRLRRRAG